MCIRHYIKKVVEIPCMLSNGAGEETRIGLGRRSSQINAAKGNRGQETDKRDGERVMKSILP